MKVNAESKSIYIYMRYKWEPKRSREDRECEKLNLISGIFMAMI